MTPDPDDEVETEITEGHQHAEEFLAALGFRGTDVTEILFTRLADAGRRKAFTVTVTFMNGAASE